METTISPIGSQNQVCKQLKIAFIVNEFPVISETFIFNQIIGLKSKGHQVDIYAVDGTSSKIDIINNNHFQNCIFHEPYIPTNRLCRVIKGLRFLLTKLGHNPLALFKSLNFFKYGKYAASLNLLYASISHLNSQTYDIIHCHFGPNGIKGVLLKDIGVLKGKVITTFHGYDVNKLPKQYNINYHHLFQRGDLYTVNSDFTANKLAALGCPKEKIIKLPVGLDLSHFKFKKRMLHSGEPIKIITVARLVEKKGCEYSIKAVAKIAKKHPNIIYNIVGDGNLRQSLESLIEQLNIADKVKLLGWKNHDEIAKLYAESHIFVLASVTAADGDMEGQGLVLQEAQAMGMPVLSTQHNGIPEGILAEKSGILVPEKNIDALAEKLCYLVENPQVWSEMGRAGRAFVESKYNIDHLTNRLIEIYQSLVDQN